MAATPAASIRGSRRQSIYFCNAANLTGNADVTNYILGNATLGALIGKVCRIVRLEVFGNIVTAADALSGVTVKAYKGSVAAGNVILSSGVIVTTATGAVTANSEVVVNAGKDLFLATDTLIVELFYDGVGGTSLSSGNWHGLVTLETDD